MIATQDGERRIKREDYQVAAQEEELIGGLLFISASSSAPSNQPAIVSCSFRIQVSRIHVLEMAIDET